MIPPRFEWNTKDSKYYLPDDVVHRDKYDDDSRYNEVCEFMLVKGLEFLDDAEKKYPTDINPKYGTLENIVGIASPMNKTAEELDKFLIWKVSDYFGARYSATGFMHQMVVSEITWISKNGWDKYLVLRRQNKKRNKK
jgi:hypothetical protein